MNVVWGLGASGSLQGGRIVSAALVAVATAALVGCSAVQEAAMNASVQADVSEWQQSLSDRDPAITAPVDGVNTCWDDIGTSTRLEQVSCSSSRAKWKAYRATTTQQGRCPGHSTYTTTGHLLCLMPWKGWH